LPQGSLKAILDAQYEAFNVEDSATDPVQFVHRANAAPADREIVGFIAAGLAFGRVASVMASVGRVTEVMGASPARNYMRKTAARTSCDLNGSTMKVAPTWCASF